MKRTWQEMRKEQEAATFEDVLNHVAEGVMHPYKLRKMVDRLDFSWMIQPILVYGVGESWKGDDLRISWEKMVKLEVWLGNMEDEPRYEYFRKCFLDQLQYELEIVLPGLKICIRDKNIWFLKRE